jgi:predicted SprT family Zn-dependent metalloprotease
MINEIFGELTCLKEVPRPEHVPDTPRKLKYYLFSCSCGNTHITSGYHVRRKKSPTTRCSECKKTPKNKVNMVGKTFDRLTCLKEVPTPKGIVDVNHSFYLFKCTCGAEFISDGCDIRRRKILSCKNCSVIDSTGEKSIFWQGFGEISKSWWNQKILKRIKLAKNKKIDLTITIEEAWSLFLKQNRKCALSGIELTFPKNTKKKYNGTASLDRINSKFGYVEGNVQWVHKDINIMKMAKSDKEFIEICHLISDYQRNKQIV